MRLALPLAALLAACSSDPAPTPGPDAAPEVGGCSDVGGPCTCPTPTGGYPGTRICINGSPACFCPFPDAAADAPLEAAMDAVAVADAAPDAPAPTDAPSPPIDAVAVADAAPDALRDVPPDRRSCGEGVPPRCVSHADCAICLPTGTGTAWCCNFTNGFCRATTDRSTCE